MLVLLALFGCGGPAKASLGDAGPEADLTFGRAPTQPSTVVGLVPIETGTGLKYYVLREGDGATPQRGQTCRMHYTGWLSDGTKFDSSLDRGRPFEFQVGIGQVIKGWDEGVGAMKVGERRQLHIPPALGYGARGAGGVIPPNANLIFDVELLGLK